MHKSPFTVILPLWLILLSAVSEGRRALRRMCVHLICLFLLTLKVNSSMSSWQADIPQALQTSPTRLWKLSSPPHLRPRSKSRHFSLTLALSLMVLLCVEEENGKARFWLPSPCVFEDLGMCICVCVHVPSHRILGGYFVEGKRWSEF